MGNFRRQAFTLIELLSTVAILAVIVTAAMFYVGGYVTDAKRIADQQTLTILNDAITRYKCEGGDVNALTEGTPLNNLLAALQAEVTWAGKSHQFLRSSYVVPAGMTLAAVGSRHSYRLTQYGSYDSEPGVGSALYITHDGYGGASAAETIPIGRYSNGAHYATYFDASADYSVARCVLRAFKTTNPAQTFTVKIYSDDTNVPDAQIGGNSSSFDQADLPTSEGDVEVLWSSSRPALVSGTRYWLVISGAPTDASDYGEIATEAVSFPGFFCTQASDGASWGGFENTRVMKFRLYSLP